MVSLTVEKLVKLAEQLSEHEQSELLERLGNLRSGYQRPSQTLRVFHVEKFPEKMTLHREDEYGDDGR